MMVKTPVDITKQQNTGKKVYDSSSQPKVLPFRAKIGSWQEFLHNRILIADVAAFVLIWIAAAIKPYDRWDWLLENLLVFVGVGFLAFTYRYFRFGNLSYILITAFMVLHVVGANYSYTTTPVDALLKGLFGFNRDNYDRIVHFCFGLLLTYPICEVLGGVLKIRGFWKAALAVAVILAFSAFYELIEMWVAQLTAPELGVLFLGTQGDPWDTQKDMADALYGCLLSIPFIFSPFRHITIIRCNKEAGIK